MSSPLVAFGLSAALSWGENLLSAAFESQKRALSIETLNTKSFLNTTLLITEESFTKESRFTMYGSFSFKFLVETGVLNLSFCAVEFNGTTGIGG
ncbi:hypothetical protein D1609_12060 [Leptospira borgpetersenii serovar Hardjo-bovis]|nr:hypothetical protein B9T54_12130 [Leptospira borgpetersenii serovar Hardjo-bovis]AYR09086.1 hypothetical protein D1609_12060 [Leptospira borgpetersenii serovar Hardjo-bovis]TQE52094.1 hypothetical protein FFZ95_11875 [Leptospira borgpetersenii]